MKEYETMIGRTYILPDTNCVFCKFCTDVYMDYTHGIYAIMCVHEENPDENEGFNGRCKYFEEESEE